MQELFFTVTRLGSDYFQRIRMFSRNVRLLILSQFFIGLGMTFIGLLFNLYLQEAGRDKAFIGYVLALSHITTAVVALPAGYLAGRYNHKVLLVLSQTLSGFAQIGVILAVQPNTLFGCIIVAVSFSTLNGIVTGPFIMCNSSPAERTYVFSVSAVIGTVAAILGNTLGGLVKGFIGNNGISTVQSYQYTLLIGLGIALLGVIPLLFIRLSEPVCKADEARPSFWPILKQNRALVLRAMVPEFLIAVGAGLIVQFMNLYFKDTFGSSDQSIGVYMSAQSATMVFALLLAPVLAEKIGKVRTIAFTRLVSIPFMIVLALTGHIEIAVAAFIIRTVLMNMTGPVLGAFYLGLCPPELQGILVALFATTGSIAWAGSSVIFGRLLNGNYTIAFFIAAGLYTIASMLFYLFFRKAEVEYN